MTFRSFLFLAAAAALSLGTGCAANDVPAEDTEESVDELNGGLRQITIVKGSMTEAGTITVAYEPNAYAPTSYVPFLAVELTPADDAPAAATPGAPRPRHSRSPSPATSRARRASS